MSATVNPLAKVLWATFISTDWVYRIDNSTSFIAKHAICKSYCVFMVLTSFLINVHSPYDSCVLYGISYRSSSSFIVKETNLSYNYCTTFHKCSTKNIFNSEIKIIDSATKFFDVIVYFSSLVLVLSLESLRRFFTRVWKRMIWISCETRQRCYNERTRKKMKIHAVRTCNSRLRLKKY